MSSQFDAAAQHHPRPTSREGERVAWREGLLLDRGWLARAAQTAPQASRRASAVRSSVINPLTSLRFTAASMPGSLRSPIASAITSDFSRDGSGAEETRSLVMPSIRRPSRSNTQRSEEHTSELQSRENLVCRLLLEKK